VSRGDEGTDHTESQLTALKGICLSPLGRVHCPRMPDILTAAPAARSYGRGMRLQELAGKVAIVTGGAGGIGRATGELLVAEGASVVIADVDVDRGREVAAQIGEAADFKQTDVSDADEVQALVDFAVDRFGGLDIMFNNAGIGSALKRFLPDDLEDFSRIMSVNLFGVIAGSQRAARYMKDHGGGSIINNASIAAVNAGTGMISYRASKAAVAHATKCMAIDLAPYGIRVNCLTPAHIRTGITTYEMGPVLRYMQPLEREAQPEDVANAVVFLASERAAQVTGIVLPIDGGTTAGPPYAQTKLIMSTAKPPEEATTGTP
jgi:NAD(P)-dependent dehydrogenase (short-subunit alcohol dehydrogenase family)